jgi:chromosome segregation ATPase
VSGAGFERLASSARGLGSMIEQHDELGGDRLPTPSSEELSAALEQIRRAASLLASLEDRSNDLQASYDELSARSERERREAERSLRAAEARAEQALERARVAEEQLRDAKDQLRQLAALVHEELAPQLRGRSGA